MNGLDNFICTYYYVPGTMALNYKHILIILIIALSSACFHNNEHSNPEEVLTRTRILADKLADINGRLEKASAAGDSALLTKLQKKKAVLATSIEPLSPYDEKVTVSIAGIVPSGEDRNVHMEKHNTWKAILERHFNLRIAEDFIVSHESVYFQKLAVKAASGDLPDFFCTEADLLGSLVQNDSIHQLERYFPWLAIEMRTALEADPVCLKVAKVNGSLYAYPLPEYPRGTFLWVRTDWLRKLGLDEPATYEEMVMVSRQFRYADPDNDSFDDTFGLTFSFNSRTLKGLLLSAGLQLKKKDGMIVISGVKKSKDVKTRVRQFIEHISRLQQQGTIQLFKQNAGFRENIIDGKTGMLTGTPAEVLGMLQDSISSNDTADWKALPLPGRTSSQALLPGRIHVPWVAVVNKGFPHPELPFKLASLYYEKALSVNSDSALIIDRETRSGGPLLLPLVYHDLFFADYDAARKIQSALIRGEQSAALRPEYQKVFKNVSRYMKTSSSRYWYDYAVFGPEGTASMEKQFYDEGIFISESDIDESRADTILKMNEDELYEMLTGTTE